MLHPPPGVEEDGQDRVLVERVVGEGGMGLAGPVDLVSVVAQLLGDGADQLGRGVPGEAGLPLRCREGFAGGGQAPPGSWVELSEPESEAVVGGGEEGLVGVGDVVAQPAVLGEGFQDRCWALGAGQVAR
nr:hypothetical protein [Streptacidiphilus fuscans]